MSIRTVCPSCRKVYNLDDSMQGKSVRCRECQSPITVPALPRQGRRDDSSRPADDRISTSSRPANAKVRASRDDDKPQRRPAERRSNRQNKDSQNSKNLLPILLGAGAAVLVLGGLLIGGVIFVFLGTNKSSEPVAAAANQPPPVPADGKVDAMPGAASRFAAGPGVEPPKGAGGAIPADPPNRAETAIPPGPVPKEMAADVVQKVKQSTTYLRVALADGNVAQGSGFFAVERDLVITNAHVVGMLRGGRPPRGIEVVIHSGDAGEEKRAGTLLGVDRANDLAVLRVQGDLSRLPPLLPIASTAELVETQKVYIFGFPFGAQLGKNITVSTSSISALRRGDDGVLKEVQVNGGMNPGNSGGPVTDARGAIIGVSVAGISGTQINFAVPADFIRPLVERSKRNPLDLTQPPGPGPLARNNPPAGPVSASSLAEDLAALKGTWESGSVGADGGGATGTVKLSITPQPGDRGGHIRLEIATKQGGRTTSSTSNYSFTLEQKGSERLLVTTIRRGVKGTVRGMIFIYRFEGDQLILTGVIASTRLTYKLENVPLRRTSAEPEQAVAGNPANPANPASPPLAAGGSGKGKAVALKFSGNVFSFIEEAVREKRLADVDIRGFTLNKNIYRDVPDKGGILIGFQVGLGKFVNNDIVKSFRPIFQTKSGVKLGNWQGPIPAVPITIKAKPGYVVSALSVRTALSIDAITVTFAKLGKDGLDLDDTYNSKTIGGNGGQLSSIGGTGALFVGITGHQGRDGAPSSLGLVAVLPKD
ncbi:MAG TPA: trypsin-like peptidase domain-containing protein [Gemmataceae bacterium]|nr:trypsin-like peptidase domain-containing protein [Gemmataceae bacterium]